MKEGEAATAIPAEEGDLLDDILALVHPPQQQQQQPSKQPLRSTFFDDETPALSPTLAPLAPLSPTQSSIFDQEPDLQLSPTSFRAPVLSSTDMNSAPQPPPEMQLSEDPWAALVSESTESEAFMDEAIDLLSSQPPPLKKEKTVVPAASMESKPLVPEPVTPFMTLYILTVSRDYNSTTIEGIRGTIGVYNPF
jgi:hypothetical protein